jgi:O-antigen ligase
MILVLVGVFVLVWSVMAINYQISDYLGGWDKASGEKRWELIKISGLMIKDNLLMGVGAGNFLIKLPEYLQKNGIVWLQPVHNIFLLALSELGILGVVTMVFLIIKNRLIRLGNKKWWWLAILVTGMVDHYWLTLPQNSWLLALIMII